MRERNVAMVYQQFINYPSMTVADNIASPLKLQGALDRAGIAARVADQAAGGEILITEPVRRAVRDVPGIELGGAREVDLKGVRDSPDLYPVLMPVDA